MSKRHAVCDKDGRVVNVVLWDGETPWHPHDPTHYLVQHDEADITDQHYVDNDGDDEVHWFDKHVHMPVDENASPEEKQRPKVVTSRKVLKRREKSIVRTDGKNAILKVHF